jgi:transposase
MQIQYLHPKIKAIDRTILARHRGNELSRRLATIAGVGIITATALAWIGVMPRQS